MQQHGWTQITIPSEISEAEKDIPCDLTYVWNLNTKQMNLSMRLTNMEKRRGRGEMEKGWIGSLRFADANCYIYG